MRKLSKILAVVDPSVRDQPAMMRAAWLAEKSGARLELFVCYYNEYLTDQRLIDSSFLTNARVQLIEGYVSYLEELAKPMRADGIDVNTAAVWDHPLDEGIVRHAVNIGADIVFKDTHHHSAIRRAILNNTDWNLIRNCPMPLWLVKPIEFSDPPTFIAAIDPLHEHGKPAILDDEVLSVGERISASVGGTLHAFHSYDPRFALATTPDVFIPSVAMPYDDILEEMHDYHAQKFNRVLSYYDVEEDRAHLKEGLTHEALPACADELGASVVIMGSISRSRLKRLFIGATAERTLETLPCDLLVVKPEWFETPVEMSANEPA